MDQSQSGSGHGRRGRLDPLVRELMVILAIKVAALVVIWFAFFSGPEEGGSAGAVADKLLQSPSAPAPGTDNRS